MALLNLSSNVFHFNYVSAFMFFNLLSLYILFWILILTYLSVHKFFLQVCLICLLLKLLTKATEFISVIVAFNYKISILFFFIAPSILPFNFLNTLIYRTLISLFDNSNICIICGLILNYIFSFFSQYCFFMPCYF